MEEIIKNGSLYIFEKYEKNNDIIFYLSDSYKNYEKLELIRCNIDSCSYFQKIIIADNIKKLNNNQQIAYSVNSEDVLIHDLITDIIILFKKK